MNIHHLLNSAGHCVIWRVNVGVCVLISTCETLWEASSDMLGCSEQRTSSAWSFFSSLSRFYKLLNLSLTNLSSLKLNWQVINYVWRWQRLESFKSANCAFCLHTAELKINDLPCKTEKNKMQIKPISQCIYTLKINSNKHLHWQYNYDGTPKVLWQISHSGPCFKLDLIHHFTANKL